jgi:hypothetical protein
MDSQLKLLLELLESATANLSEEQMKWSREGKWCTGEILEHLYLTYTGTVKGLERTLAHSKPEEKRPSIKHRVRTSVVFGLNYMPSGRKAPNSTLPRGLQGKNVRAEIASKIGVLDELLTQCEARFGRGKLLNHPFLGPLSAAQWRKFHLIHGRHHAKQIDRLRRQMSEIVVGGSV